MRTKLYLAPCGALEDGALFARALAAVPAARREKVLRLSGGARRLSLGAGLLLRRALAAEGLTAEDYSVDARGRPCFPSLPDFHFSLSHSGELAMCAVSAGPVGCDLERLRELDVLRLAGRVFHPEENAFLLSLPEAERQAAFFRLWTCKESYMKALGLGFALPMNAFSVSLGGGPALRGAEGGARRFLSFREGAYFCALYPADAPEDVTLIRTDPVREVTP